MDDSIQHGVSNAKHSPAKVIIRTHRPGDMGLITYRHGVLYAKEYGCDSRFEALVARITADFIDHYDSSKERCWIADRDGEFLGCIMLVKALEGENTAKLRLLLVEKEARGLGLGGKLTREAVEFARAVGYSQIRLWTQSVLTGARQLYGKLGFNLVETEEHESWGAKWVGENWVLEL